MSIGITSPLRLAKSGDFQTESEAALVDASIRQTVMTRSSGEGIYGEMPWNPAFGTLVQTLKHHKQDLDLVQAEAVRMTSNGVSRYVPDAIITDVQVSDIKKDQGRLLELKVTRKYRETIKSLKMGLV